MKTVFDSPYLMQVSDYILKEENFNYNFNHLSYPYKSKVYSKKLSFLKAEKKLEVIDLGCGIGSLLKFYETLDINECKLIDTNPNFLKICGKFIDNNNLKNNYITKEQSLFDVNQKKKYNLAVCSGVINYFKKEEQEKALITLADLSSKFLIIEIIHENSFFKNVFKIFENIIMKKIIFFVHILLSKFINLIKIFGKKNRFFLFVKQCSFLARDLGTNYLQAKNTFSSEFYINELKKKNFELISKFGYKSLYVLVFKEIS